MFKSMADVKRKLVVGSRWHCLHHGWYPTFSAKDMGVRSVTRVQSNSFAFHNSISGEDSWCNWPKKSGVIFATDKPAFTILQEDQKTPLLTYTLIEEA